MSAPPLQLLHPRTGIWLDTATCGDLPKQCKNSQAAIFQLAFSSGIIVLCFVMFVVYAYRALRDHAKLPYSHYRLTNIFVRIQVRYWTGAIIWKPAVPCPVVSALRLPLPQVRNSTAVLLAVVCGVMGQETAGLGTCVGFIDSQVSHRPA